MGGPLLDLANRDSRDCRFDPRPTAATSAAAEPTDESASAQRERVYAAIVAAGERGATDDELQVALGLNGSSQRPRRLELWRANRIRAARDDRDDPVKRMTRTGHRAVVWVVAGR